MTGKKTLECQVGNAHHCTGSFIEVHVEMLVELFHVLFFQPFFCICKLTDCALDVKLSGPQISSKERKQVSKALELLLSYAEVLRRRTAMCHRRVWASHSQHLDSTSHPFVTAP